MRIDAGYFRNKDIETGVEHITGYYLDLGRWTFILYKEDQWSRWTFDYWRDPK